MNGMEAPDWRGQVGDNEYIALADFRGKYLVLYFYPKDSTPGCTTEANDFESLRKDFAKINTEIVGVSRDSLKSHNKFCEKNGLKFPLISDPEGKICSDYGVWVEKSMFGRKYMGIQRATFLINPKGMVESAWHNVNVKGHAQTVLETVQKLNDN